MGEKEDKEKAEKLAAAKKRVAQLKKKSKAAGGAGETSTKAKSKAKAKDEPAEDTTADTAVEGTEPAAEESIKPVEDEAEPDADESAFNDAIKAANEAPLDDDTPPATSSSPTGKPARAHPTRAPSISLQSKIRSASFRQGATSPSHVETPVDTELPDIYRKQLQRIEELETENKRLAHEAQDRETRWRKTEEELEELREKAVDDENKSASTTSQEVSKLRAEVDALRRNSRQSISVSTSSADETLRKDLESKDSTITSLQLELSRLRSQLTTLEASAALSDPDEQVAALQSSITRLETTNIALTQELADTKKSLDRASQKGLTDSTTLTSRDTRITELERELSALNVTKTDLELRNSSFEKKLEALQTLIRETEARNTPKLSTLESLQKDHNLLKSKHESLEKENIRLREAHKRNLSGSGANDDAGLDDLEDETRRQFEARIRALESENFDLRRGVWRDQRRALQPNLSSDQDTDGAAPFDDVDLNTSANASRRPSAPQAKHSNFAQVLTSVSSAFRPPQQQHGASTTGRPRNDSLLQDFSDDDAAFDEAAFASAQREEEMRKMVEHVREVKRGLKNWTGWRLDLVDQRKSSGGIGDGPYGGQGYGWGMGEVFEV